MYLLKQYLQTLYINLLVHLHSTMYLLKLFSSSVNNFHTFIFTFHYVSIKTALRYDELIADLDLHSTMYLLKRTKPHPLTVINMIYIPLCIY